MIICKNKEKFEFIKTIRNHGITKSLKERYQKGFPWEYDIKNEGYNYRIDELRSNLGYNQLKRIRKINLLRKKASDYYYQKLKNIEGIAFQNISKNNQSAHHLYVIRIKENFGINRNNIYKKLLKKGIQTSVHYKPLHMFSLFKNYKNKELQNSKKLFDEILSLPLYTGITKKHQDLVIKELISTKF
jgi:dTDP-4-amino-4,6-dideoxygalactose transaminase